MALPESTIQRREETAKQQNDAPMFLFGISPRKLHKTPFHPNASAQAQTLERWGLQSRRELLVASHTLSSRDPISSAPSVRQLATVVGVQWAATLRERCLCFHLMDTPTLGLGCIEI